MIHIVFQAADTDTLQKAIELDESLTGKIIRIKDDYAVGPLGDLTASEGWQARRDWWKSVLQYSPYFAAIAEPQSGAAGAAGNAGAQSVGAGTDALDMAQDRMTLHQLKGFLDENEAEEAWIWMAQNQHDVCGYYWLVSHLAAYQGRIQVLYLNNLPFLNEKGNIFYPTALFEIQPSEFRKARKLARPVTLSEFEIDPDEWTRLSRENAGVRLLEGGKKIVTKDFDFYDKDLLGNLTGNWQKMHRLLVNTVNRMKIKTGDAFLAWRLRVLIAEGKVQLNGDLSKGWSGCEVKLPGAESEAIQKTESPQKTEIPQNL
jgi:hypothetical protein